MSLGAKQSPCLNFLKYCKLVSAQSMLIYLGCITYCTYLIGGGGEIGDPIS